MAGKRYYWLKLQVGFFQELIIKQLRTLPEGDSIVLLYLKLLLKAINTEGIIYYQNILPSLDEEIALDTGEKPALVKLTISALCQYHAAVFLDDQSLQLLYLEDMVGSESTSASRVRNHRANQKLIKEKERATLQCNETVTEGNTTEISGSIEIENSKKEEVKLLMKQNQVKQWEVAEAMGISEFTLCRWLRKDLKGKQLERLNSAIKKVRSGKEETHGKEER